MGVAVEYLWGVLIKQAYISGVINLIFAAISFIAIIVIVNKAPKLYKHFDEKYRSLRDDRIKNGTGYNGSFSVSSFEEDNARNVKDCVIPVSITFGMAFLIIFVICIINGTGRVYNPDYYALKEILNAVGGV